MLGEKIFFSPSPNSPRFPPATIVDVAGHLRFSREIGFRTVTATRSLENIFTYYAKLLKSWKKAGIFLAMYPIFCRPRPRPFGSAFNSPQERILSLLDSLNPQVHSILYVNDLPIEQAMAFNKNTVFDGSAQNLESTILRSFRVLCVFNRNMKKAISARYNIPEDRFIEFEMLDYGITVSPKPIERTKGEPWKIVYAGNLSEDYVGDWMMNLEPSSSLRYEFLGLDGHWISKLGRPDITYRGFFSSQEHLANYISTNADLGIIAVSDGMRKYCQYGSTSKFGAYISAGLPVVVSSDYRYISHLVRKYDVGMVFESFGHLDEIVRNMTVKEYNEMRNRCLALGEQLRNGYFFKRAIETALNIRPALTRGA